MAFFWPKEVGNRSWFDLESSALVLIITEEGTGGPFGKHLDLLAKLVVQCTGVEIRPSTDRALVTPTIYDCLVYEIDQENNYIPATVVTVLDCTMSYKINTQYTYDVKCGMSRMRIDHMT